MAAKKPPARKPAKKKPARRVPQSQPAGATVDNAGPGVAQEATDGAEPGEIAPDNRPAGRGSR